MTSPLFGAGQSPGSWFNPTGGYSWDAHYGVAPHTAIQLAARPSGQGAPQQSGQMSADDTRKWDEYIATIKEAMMRASGWEREKLEQQYADAAKGRENAYKIAELTNTTSRYGIDERSRIELKQLQENQRQFDANHGLEQQKFGLNVADSYAKFASGPDMMFMRNDFMDGMERVGQGLGVKSYGSGGQQPRARTWGDFAALSGYNMPSVQANQSGGGAQQSGGGGSNMTTDSNGDGVPDARVKAVRGIVDAIPPSDTDGTDDNDWAALNAIESVFRARRPNAYNKMRGGQQKAFAAGLSRKGYYAPDAIEDMQRSGIGQGSARAA